MQGDLEGDNCLVFDKKNLTYLLQRPEPSIGGVGDRGGHKEQGKQTIKSGEKKLLSVLQQVQHRICYSSWHPWELVSALSYFRYEDIFKVSPGNSMSNGAEYISQGLGLRTFHTQALPVVDVFQ